MTVFAVVCALATATWIGYHVGRRAGSTPSTWKKRTSRIALGRLAISLLVLMTARGIRQRVPGRAHVTRCGEHLGTENYWASRVLASWRGAAAVLLRARSSL